MVVVRSKVVFLLLQARCCCCLVVPIVMVEALVMVSSCAAPEISWQRLCVRVLKVYHRGPYETIGPLKCVDD